MSKETVLCVNVKKYIYQYVSLSDFLTDMGIGLKNPCSTKLQKSESIWLFKGHKLLQLPSI